MTRVLNEIAEEDWTLEDLEDVVDSCIDYDLDNDDDDDDDEKEEQFGFGLASADAYSLNCRRPPMEYAATLLGLYDSIVLHLEQYFDDNDDNVVSNYYHTKTTTITIYEPTETPAMTTTMTTIAKDWSIPALQEETTPPPQCNLNHRKDFQWGMSLLDLTASSDNPTNANIYEWLQSLACIHDPTLHHASPWYTSTGSDDDRTIMQGLGVLIPLTQVPSWKQFCVGHAIPSYQLHAILPLSIKPPFFNNNTSTSNNSSHDKNALLIYRPFPPRDFLQPSLTTRNVETNNDNDDTMLYRGTLWETYPKSKEGEENVAIWNVRQVATPFQNGYQLFPFMKQIMMDSTVSILQNEIQKIPSTWTPWPEKTHYSSENSWTIFPLCHTFPATDLSTRKWISSTCELVPNTVEILKRVCGDNLRTALFSKLDADTHLNAHTGWADLANHVCRLHIPVTIPEDGCCGVWVDGCVEVQTSTNLICFDDSKVHRAFNYSTSQQRIVLIIDLLRPLHLIPPGTATGQHTEELDTLLQQFQ